MGTSGGKGSTESAFGEVLAQIAEQTNREADPTRRALFHQMSELLQGKLYGSGTIPLIQSSVGAARAAGGQAIASTQANLAQAGAGDSPFATAIRSQLSAQINQNISNVPVGIAQGFLGAAPGMVTGVGGQALSGLANASQTNLQTTQGMGYGQVGLTALGAILGAG